MIKKTDQNLNIPMESLLQNVSLKTNDLKLKGSQLKGLTMFYKTFALVMCLSTSSLAFAASAGAGSGGGGGGICTPKSCMTLAQAGLRINEEKTDEFELDQEVVEEVSRIVKSIPLKITYKNYLIENAIGSKGTFLVVDEKEKNKFDKFKKEYFEILKSSNMDSQGFELLAVSQKPKTYLLPGFELLDTRGKALLLIHEVVIRSYNASVKQALTLDGYLLDFLNALDSGSISKYDFWPMIQLLGDMKLIQKWEMEFNFLQTAIQKNGGRIAHDEVCTKNSFRDTACEVNRFNALSLRKLHPDFAKKLTNTDFSIERAEARILISNISRYDENIKAAVTNLINLCRKDPSVSGMIVSVDDAPVANNNYLFRIDCNEK